VFGEEQIYRSAELWLGRVDVGLPSGERVWEEVVRVQRVASIALVDAENRVLLVGRERFLAGLMGWELPGGFVDDGEDPAAGAVRQAEDVAGYRPGRVNHLITFRPMAETVDCEHRVFVGVELERVGDPTDVEDVTPLRWVPVREVPDLITEGHIWHGGTLVGLMRLLTMDGWASAR
jgi:8-oxo-dGDP phosphatase